MAKFKLLQTSKSFIIASIVVGGIASSSSFASQYGKVVVDEAKVYELPNEASNLVTTLVKDDYVAASNQPTEGFYKIRTEDEQVGWISGNDIIVGPAAKPNAKPGEEVVEEAELPPEKPSWYEYSRVIIAGGMQYLNYGAIVPRFSVSDLNLGFNGLLEFQFRLFKYAFWALRTEVFTAGTGDKAAGSGKQNASHLTIPIQLGVVFSPFTFKSFRLGFGGYAGMTAWSKFNVTQTTTTEVAQLNYSSYDFCWTGSGQMSFKLTEKMALFFEAAYRAQKTGTLPASSKLGGVSAMVIDYSGYVGRLGVEFRI